MRCTKIIENVCYNRSGGCAERIREAKEAKNTSFQVFRKILQQSQADEKVLALRVEAFLLTSPVFVAFQLGNFLNNKKVIF